MSLADDLLKRYEGDDERVGFILKSGEIVEVENMAVNKTDGFDVSGDDLVKYENTVVATWHTHPKSDNNLSVGDYESFRSWAELDHYIIGSNGVRKYVVRDNEVLIEA